ncbi:hypothetical protein H0H81_000704 [Sphagnurus paluster]|uniref:RanBD1 domain-containing protein n=1 Tax=Sphagnurus paluster TaxID=117069 RepID=A0A9P7FT04_9AGAR|nr:hypothetical protein H0H81_000704 [Sphagnurus paluster]
MVSDDVDQASVRISIGDPLGGRLNLISQTPASSTSDESVEETPPPRTPEPSLPAVLQTFSTPSPVFGSSANISSPLPKASLQRSSQRAFTSNAFSAFAGSTSPFSGFKTVSTSGKPAWMTADISTSKNDVSERSNAADEDSPSLVTPSNHVLDAAIVASKTAIEHITGEENEDVSSELKGVKLFIKRGNKAFSEGMVGHVKLLSDKKTQEQRVLLRREPLWQVSMNIRMHPTVRCIFDAGENVLRLILKEAIEQKDVPSQDWKHEVVVYALKVNITLPSPQFTPSD